MHMSVLAVLILCAMMLSSQAQLFCDRTDTNYTKCDHTKPVCECSKENSKLIGNDYVCRFCFEIEQRHTFTRYVLYQDKEIEIPGYGGSVWHFNETGQLEALPNSDPSPCVNDPSRCTVAYTTDGNSFRPIITVNNRFPAPTLVVPSNAIVLVDVYNRLSSEATTIHWHGMHQMNTPWMDGVEHITQCGIAPSSSFRYIFRANPPGTHWYHSHSGAQRTDGLFGALIVKESSEPDTFKELGPVIDKPEYVITLIDWQKENSLDLFAQIHAGIRYFNQDGVPPTPTRTADAKDPRVPRTCSPDGTEVGPVSYWSGLINGRGRHRDVSYNKTLLHTFTVQSNTSYRFRLIGAQSLFAYRFSIDEHELNLIATDGHFVKKKTLDFIIIHSGERYDFLLQTKVNASKKNFIIRAETLEVNGSDPNVCSNGTGQLFPLFSDHSAEAILHYGNDTDIPSNLMYQEIADSAISKSMECATNRSCKAVNCPFEGFPKSYGIDCIHIHELDLLNDSDQGLPDFSTNNTLFFNFGFEGDGSTSAINGINFVFPPAPLQLSQNDNIPTKCNLSATESACDSSGRLVTPDCLCTHVREIEYGESYRFVFTATGPNRTNNRNWNFAHPIHLHGHSFHVAKIGFGDYSDTGRIASASEDIKCEKNDFVCTKPNSFNDMVNQGKSNKQAPPLKDTVLIPAGGYAVVYFKANNPGYWFLHCHIEVHQLEGMAVVIHEAERPGMPNHLPSKFPHCGNFSWEPDEFRQLESMTRQSQLQMTATPSATPSIRENTVKNVFKVFANLLNKIIVSILAVLGIILFLIILIVIIIGLVALCRYIYKRKSTAKAKAANSTKDGEQNYLPLKTEVMQTDTV